MKIHILVFLFFASNISHAQILRRQSLYAMAGLLERYTFNPIQTRDFSIDFTDQEQTKTLAITSSISRTDRLADPNNTFDFLNDKDSFKKMFNKDLGVCRGFASLRMKFRHLAIFDPQNESGTEIPNPKTNIKAYRRFYRKLIRKIRNYRPTIIPGFANLKELSSDPYLDKVLRWQVYHEWRVKNFAKGTGTGDLLLGVFKKTTHEELLNLRNRIETLSHLNLNTMIWLAQAHSSWIHVLEAVEVSPLNESGEFTIKFWNDKSVEPDKIYSYLTVDANGNMTYDDKIESRPINAIGIPDEYEGELIRMGENLSEFIRENP